MNTELGVGSPAPDFKLMANTNLEIGLADYKGQAHVALFFVREYY